MLCPNCGTRMTTEHKFCRNCGMNLEPVSRALAAHLSHDGATAAAAAARGADRRAAQRTTRGLLTGIIVVLFGVFMMAVPLGNAFKVLGLMSALLGIVFVLVTMLSTLRVSALADAAPAPPPQLPDVAPPTGRLLDESRIEPVPSVTDHTTELLGVKVKDRKARE